MELPENRIVLVHNPNGSNARLFTQYARFVLESAHFPGHVTIFETPSSKIEDNIDAVAEMLSPDDVINACGGDGTMHIVANGVLRSEQAIRALAVSNFGNVGDAANVFNGKSHMRSPQVLSAAIHDDRIIPVHPLEISINNTFWRFGILYASFGDFAAIAHHFNEGDIREHLHRQSNSLANNALHGLTAYLRIKSQLEYPEYRLNDNPALDYHDLVFLNSPRMAGLRLSESHLADRDFKRSQLDISPSLPKSLLVAARMAIAPVFPLGGVLSHEDTMYFDDPTNLHIHADGEASLHQAVKSVTVRKDQSENARALPFVSIRQVV